MGNFLYTVELKSKISLEMFLVFRFRTSIVISVRPQTNINVLINDFSQVVFDFFFLFTSILICRTYSSDFFKLRLIENYISTFGN